MEFFVQELGPTCWNFLVGWDLLDGGWIILYSCFMLLYGTMMETVFWNSFVWVGKLIMAGMYGLLWLECDYNIIMQMVVYIL